MYSGFFVVVVSDEEEEEEDGQFLPYLDRRPESAQITSLMPVFDVYPDPNNPPSWPSVGPNLKHEMIKIKE